MKLILDIGNTAIKAGLFNGAHLVRASVFSDRSDLDSVIEDFLLGEAVGSTAFASVVPGERERAVQALTRLTGVEPVEVGAASALPITLSYLTPETLGADRIAAAVAAFMLYGSDESGVPRPVIAVDAGTALTIEVVTAGGDYLGGAIAPGPRLLSGSLHAGTAQLPEISLELPDVAIGRSTTEAMQVGVMSGFAGAVERLLRGASECLDATLVVIATGGWAPFLLQEVSAVDIVAPHLVLDGIRLIADHAPGATG
ncbi:type III pantothenate kinase [soil metagenome]